MEKQIRRGCQLGPPARLSMLTLRASGSVGPEHGEIPLNFSDLIRIFRDIF